MRTDILSFILSSENRKRIVKTLFEYPKRSWSCYAVEDVTKIPHATVFRTLQGLAEFGILKTTKINKRDIIYELTNLPLVKEIEQILYIERTTAKKIVNKFANKIKYYIRAAILYGSIIKGDFKPDSDIDVLVILKKHNKELEKKIQNIAANISNQTNKTLSVSIMDLKEVKKEKNSQFLKSVKENMEVLYGKEPF